MPEWPERLVEDYLLTKGDIAITSEAGDSLSEQVDDNTADILSRLRAVFPYAIGALYQANDTVLDNGWTMVANKETIDRAAPQPTGEVEVILPDVPAWSELINASVVYSGHRYTFTKPGWVRGLRVWISSLTASTNYRFIIIYIAPGAAPITRTIEEPVLSEDAWTVLSLADMLVLPGAELLIYIDALDASTDISWDHQWVYEGTSQFDPPAAGHANITNQGDLLRINWIDNDALNQQTDLQVVVGTTFFIFEVGTPENSIRFKTQDPYVEGADYTSYVVTQTGSNNGGPTVGSTIEIIATQPLPDPTSYVEIAGFYPGGNPSWATVEGFLQFNGVDQPGAATSAYGVDIAFIEGEISPDWDVLAASVGGGGVAGSVDHQTEILPTVRSESYANQDPAGLDIPLKIVFSGIDVISDDVTIKANGDIEFHRSGTYFLALLVNMGRDSPPGVANLIIWAELNGTPGAAAVQHTFETGNDTFTREFTVQGEYKQGDIQNVWVARDSSGMDDGGLHTFAVSATLAGLGVPDAPSSSVIINRMIIVPAIA